jgi:hypothetical protein
VPSGHTNERGEAVAEPTNYKFHYGAQSWPINKDQADRVTLLLSGEVKDGKSVVMYLAELQPAGPGRLHIVLLGPNIPAHVEGPIEDKDRKFFEILG